MSVTDIVSALERTGPTQIAMVIFLVTFFVVVGWTLLPSRQGVLKEAALLPLEEGQDLSRIAQEKGANRHVKA